LNKVVIATRETESIDVCTSRRLVNAKRIVLLLFALVTSAVVVLGGFVGRDLASARHATEPVRVENERLRARHRDLTSQTDEVRSLLQAISDRGALTTLPAAVPSSEPPNEAPK
jgi:hypothetical protein